MSPVDVVEGMNLTLTCRDNQTRSASYTWLNGTSQLLFATSTSPQSITLTNIKRSASGVYTCRVEISTADVSPKVTNVTVNVQCESE